jgi:hypothetical protein
MMADEKPPTQIIRPKGIPSEFKVGFHVPTQDEPEEKKDDK